MKCSVTKLATSIGLAGALAAGVIGLTAPAASAEGQVITIQMSGWSEDAGVSPEEFYAPDAQQYCVDKLRNVYARSEIKSVTQRNPGDDGIYYRHQTVVIRCWL